MERGVEEGADAVVHLATAPDLGSGRFFDGTWPAQAHPQAYDREVSAPAAVDAPPGCR